MRRWYSKLSLRAKVSGIALAITTLSLTVVATAGILQIRAQISVEEHRSADSVAMGFARAAELEITVGNKPELERMTASFIRDQSILFIAAYDEKNHLLASAARDPGVWDQYLKQMLSSEKCVIGYSAVESTASATDEFSSDAGIDLPAPTASPSNAPRVIGHVVVGLSTAAAVEAQQHQNALTAAVTAVAAFGGAVILFLTLGKWMRRLALLAEASWAISGGNFSGAINDKRDDEIGRLAQAFDDMRNALRKRDQELRGFTETLQEQYQGSAESPDDRGRCQQGKKPFPGKHVA